MQKCFEFILNQNQPLFILLLLYITKEFYVCLCTCVLVMILITFFFIYLSATAHMFCKRDPSSENFEPLTEIFIACPACYFHFNSSKTHFPHFDNICLIKMALYNDKKCIQ